MKTKIYVKLLDEGSISFRPVSAEMLGNNKYLIDGSEVYDPDDEEWEFQPGTTVIAEEKELNGEKIIMAIKKVV